MKQILIVCAVSVSALLTISCKKEISSSVQEQISSQSLIADSADHAGDVYVINNSNLDNKVVHCTRSADGSLVKEASYSTGGKGAGLPPGSQGSVCLSDDHKWLFFVNAGSNEISVFAVTETGFN